MDELRRAITVLFRRSGQPTISERDFILAASMDLRWFPPRDAQRMLEAALRSGLLVSDGGLLRPGFDVAAVQVPIDFAPSAAAFEAAAPPKDRFAAIVGRVAEATGLDAKAIVAEVNRVQARMGIDLVAAALLVGRAHDVPIDDFLQAVPRTPGS